MRSTIFKLSGEWRKKKKLKKMCVSFLEFVVFFSSFFTDIFFFIFNLFVCSFILCFVFFFSYSIHTFQVENYWKRPTDTHKTQMSVYLLIMCAYPSRVCVYMYFMCKKRVQFEVRIKFCCGCLFIYLYVCWKMPFGMISSSSSSSSTLPCSTKSMAVNKWYFGGLGHASPAKIRHRYTVAKMSVSKE